MKIGIFGTGIVAQTLGARVLESGHDVMFGTRDVAATSVRTQPDVFGNPPFHVWAEAHPEAKVGSFQQAAFHGEVLINATSGTGSLAALQAAGPAPLKGKILLDVSNPLDFSRGFPPSLTVCNTDSLAEQIQRAFPDARVVKSLNTVNASVMVQPALVPGDHNLFLSGNDPEAKASVTGYLSEWFGWKRQNILDLGDITSARGAEMLLPLWVRLYSVLQNPLINFQVVVGPKPQR
jgi:predicted dinucleotide-binding enzyme